MNKKIDLAEIPLDKNYIGYIWMSGSETPEEFHTPKNIKYVFKGIADNTKPFIIIEGQLYCEDEKKSYSIKHSNGKHSVIEYDLKSVPGNYVPEEKKYIPNRIQAAKIIFKQYWKPEEDELCENMEVLVPAAQVFIGFSYINEKEKKI